MCRQVQAERDRKHGSKVNLNEGQIKARGAGWQKEKRGSWGGASMIKRQGVGRWSRGTRQTCYRVAAMRANLVEWANTQTQRNTT